jgi:hypothetical protein
MQLTTETAGKLDRLVELNAILIHLGDDCSEPYYAEYREIQDELVEEFLPLVAKLAKAGLFTFCVPAKLTCNDCDFVHIEPNDVFCNGNIWIEGSEIVGGHCGEKQ